METSFLYKQKWNTRCAFMQKIKKKCHLCIFCSKNFFYGEMGRFTVYIIRGTLHDCLEKGNSNSNVILTPSAAKRCFIVKRFGISFGFTVHIIRRTLQDCLEKYISKYFPCSQHSLVEYSLTLKEKFCISVPPCNIL